MQRKPAYGKHIYDGDAEGTEKELYKSDGRNPAKETQKRINKTKTINIHSQQKREYTRYV